MILNKKKENHYVWIWFHEIYVVCVSKSTSSAISPTTLTKTSMLYWKLEGEYVTRIRLNISNKEGNFHEYCTSSLVISSLPMFLLLWMYVKRVSNPDYVIDHFIRESTEVHSRTKHRKWLHNLLYITICINIWLIRTSFISIKYEIDFVGLHCRERLGKT